jgi:hypothetical protein
MSRRCNRLPNPIADSADWKGRMQIEPTFEAWEACCRYTKTHKLAAFSRFSEVLKWIPIGAAGDNLRLTAEEYKI